MVNHILNFDNKSLKKINCREVLINLSLGQYEPRNENYDTKH